ncbi:hypothetical protein B7P43_G02055, partial [Cryptotermes secundus]
MSREHEPEDDIDIYGDIPNFPSFADTVKELQERRKVLEDEVAQLKEKLKGVTAEKNELDSKNRSLGLNISCLYKTATAEIGRKDRLIAELRREKDNIIFRRVKNVTTTESDHKSEKPGNHQYHQDTSEQTDHPAAEIEQKESGYADADNRISQELTSYKDLPPESTCTVFSRRRLNIIPENKLTSLEKSREYANREPATSCSLIPVSVTEPHKDISEKVHHNSAYLSKDIDSVSQNEVTRSVSNSENGSKLPNTRDTLHSEIKSESVHVKTKKRNIDSSKHTSHTHTVSPVPVSRHFP